MFKKTPKTQTGKMRKTLTKKGYPKKTVDYWGNYPTVYEAVMKDYK